MEKSTVEVGCIVKEQQAGDSDLSRQRNRLRREARDAENEKLLERQQQYKNLINRRIRVWLINNSSFTESELFNVGLTGLWKVFKYTPKPGPALISQFIRYELSSYVRQAGIFKLKKAGKGDSDLTNLVDKFDFQNQVEANDISEIAGGLLSTREYSLLRAKFAGEKVDRSRVCKSIKKLRILLENK